MSSLPQIATVAQIRSARVKCHDFHTEKPQLVIGLYSGEIILYDYKLDKQLKQLSVLSTPIRAVKFFCDGMYIAVGSDDGRLRVFDAYSLQIRQTIKAHTDVIRAIAVHPRAPILFTAGDDTAIRAWQYQKTSALELEAEYVGHDGYVMSLEPDYQGLRLVSASADKTIKVWDIQHYLDLAGLHAKVSANKLGRQLARREESLLDKLTAGGLGRVRSQAASMLTGLVGAARAQEAGPEARVQFDALFTLSGHTDCVNGAAWIESGLLSGGQTNPYAQGQMQFVASVGDDGEICLWDTYSRQVVKRLDGHTDAVHAVCFVRQLQLLVTAGADGQAVLYSTAAMQQERTLNFGLERGWAVTAAQAGAATLVALGYDGGTVLLRIGDPRPVCAFSGVRSCKLAVAGQFLHQYCKVDGAQTMGGIAPRAAQAIALCGNVQRGLLGEPDFRSVTDDIPTVVKAMQYSPDSKLLAIQGDSVVAILSGLTGKRKFQVDCKQFCFACQFVPALFTVADRPDRPFDYSQYESELEDKSVYAFVAEKQRRLVHICAAGETTERCSIKVDFQVERIFPGPLLCITGGNTIVFYDWEEGQFVAQLDDINTRCIVFNQAGDLCCIMADTESFLLQVNFGAIQEQLASESYDEYDGVENALVELLTIESQVTSAVFTQDSKLFVYNDQHGVHQLFMDEVVGQQTVSPVILQISQLKNTVQILGTCQLDASTERILLLGEAQSSYYDQTQLLYVAAVSIDRSILQFKEMVLGQQIDRAVEFARTNLQTQSALEFAADYLLKFGTHSQVILDMLDDTALKVKYAHKMKRYDVVTELVGGDMKMAAGDAFAGGYIVESMQLYKQLEDWDMVLLCAYILGDTEALQEVVERGEANARYRAAILLSNDEEACNALQSAAQRCVYKRARGMDYGEEFREWQQQLKECRRQDIAASLLPE